MMILDKILAVGVGCNSSSSQICFDSLPGSPSKNGSATTIASSSEIQLVLQIIFGLIGSLAVLMIIISGVRYITSAGDPQKVNKAKDGILYSLIGIVVAASAEAIVAFVLGNVK